MKKFSVWMCLPLLLLSVACQNGGSIVASGVPQSQSWSIVRLPETIEASSPADRPTSRSVLARNNDIRRLYVAGKYEQCDKLFTQALQRDPQDTTALYNQACVRAKQGQSAAAMESLKRLVDTGFCDFRRMRTDGDLASLHDLPEFRELMAREDQVQQARAKRIEQIIQAKAGGAYSCEIDPQDRLLFASGIDQTEMQDIRRKLCAQARAVQNDLFDFKLDQYVTVVMLNDSDARKMKADLGFYDDGQRTILTAQRGIILTHEFTHALHHADQAARDQVHPVWIKEGLATLFETSEVDGQHIRPLDNFRLRGVQTAVSTRRAVPMGTLFAMNQRDYMKSAGQCYPQSRYVLMYLWQKGLLKPWYEAYTANYATDRTGTLAMEKVLGKKLPQIEAEWKQWVMTLEVPPRENHEGQPSPGLRIAGSGEDTATASR